MTPKRRSHRLKLEFVAQFTKQTADAFVPECTFQWGPWRVRMTVGEIRGRLECVALQFTPWKGVIEATEAFNSAALHDFPIGAATREAREKFIWLLGGIGGIDNSAGERARSISRRVGPGRPRLYDDDHYRDVAAVYVQAPEAPTRTVAERFNTSRANAAKWVAEARQRGYLAKTSKGRMAGRKTDRRRKG